jgi:hypothetical protein
VNRQSGPRRTAPNAHQHGASLVPSRARSAPGWWRLSVLVGIRLLVGRAPPRRGAVRAENDVIDAPTFLLAIKDRARRPRPTWAHQERWRPFSRPAPANIVAELPAPLRDLGLLDRPSRRLVGPDSSRGLPRSSGCHWRHVGAACCGQ